MALVRFYEEFSPYKDKERDREYITPDLNRLKTRNNEGF